MLALVHVAAVALASPGGGLFAIVQPYTHSSPSGEWVLSVDPSSREARGSAQYVVTHRGEGGWRGERPFTLWQADITDDGFVAGYWFTQRPGSWLGAMHVTILSPDGATLLDEAHEHNGSVGPDGGPNLGTAGMFVRHQLDELVIRVRDHLAYREEPLNDEGAWWRYRIHDATPLPLVRPMKSLYEHAGLDMRQLHMPRWWGDVKVIELASTPFVVAEWSASNGSTIVVHGASFEPAWTLDVAHALPENWRSTRDTTHRVDQIRELDQRGVFLQTAGPRRFSVVLPAENQRITFEVSATDARDVREVERADFDPLPPEESVPAVALELKRVTAMHAKGLADARLFLDELGRCVAFDGNSRDVCVFSADGKLDFRAHADAGELRSVEYVAAAASNDLIVHPWSLDDVHLHLDSRGTCVGWRELGGERVAFVPRSWSRWCTDWCGEEARFVASGDRPDRRIARRPDGRWFGSLGGLTVEADGSVVLGELGQQDAHYTNWAVHIFDASGTPRRTYELPSAISSEFAARDVSTSARWILLSSWTASAYLIDRDTGVTRRFEAPPSAPNSAYSFRISPDGSELWVATSMQATLQRFALPE